MEIKDIIKCRPVLNPTKELLVSCGRCNAELARVAWETYHDYNRKRSETEKKYPDCPHCGAKFCVPLASVPKWEPAGKGRLIAKCRNGDFLIFRYGSMYKWRYRKYGNLYADELGRVRTKDYAKIVCERHKEWKL